MSTLLNIGSVSKIEIVAASEVSISMPDESNVVSLVGSPSFAEVNHTLETANLSQSHSFVNEGNMFTIIAQWLSPKINESNNLSALAYLNIPVSLKFTDANGTVYIVGYDDNPAYLNIAQLIPKEAAGFNHYIFNINYVSRYSLMVLS